MSYKIKKKLELYPASSKDPSNCQCAGCNKPINPTFCRTGSIISGMGFSTITGLERQPVLGTIETYDKSYVIGGEETRTSKNVSFYKRNKGFLCESCSSNYKTIKVLGKDGEVVRVEPIVKLDPLPGVIGQTARGSYI